jgi:hypothetical protein
MIKLKQISWFVISNFPQLLAHGRWFSPGTPASSTTKTGRHDNCDWVYLKKQWKPAKYDNGDYFNFPIVNFPFIFSNIQAAPAYGVYIPQLI